MSDEYESFEHNGFTVEICIDRHPSNPRKEFDHMATLACCHRGYTLGDEQIVIPYTEEEMREREDILAILPLYVYEHGGITMSCGAFADRWDSGQVGWGYVTRQNAEKMGCVGTYTDPETHETKAYDQAFFEQAIRGEVEEYDHYLTGAVYGYVVKDADGDELDSCWGFYGELDYVRQQAKEAAENCEPLGLVHGAEDVRCES